MSFHFCKSLKYVGNEKPPFTKIISVYLLLTCVKQWLWKAKYLAWGRGVNGHPRIFQGNLKGINQVLFLYLLVWRVVFLSTIKCFTLLVHLVCQICEIYCRNRRYVLFWWNLKAYINYLIPILKVASLRLYTLNSTNCKK